MIWYKWGGVWGGLSLVCMSVHWCAGELNWSLNWFNWVWCAAACRPVWFGSPAGFFLSAAVSWMLKRESDIRHVQPITKEINNQVMTRQWSWRSLSYRKHPDKQIQDPNPSAEDEDEDYSSLWPLNSSFKHKERRSNKPQLVRFGWTFF